MESGPLLGIGGGGGDGGSREKQRWSENKVYTRKAHYKKGLKPAPAANPNPEPPPQPPVSSQQTPAATADEVHSSPQQPPPSPEPRQHPPPPAPLESSAASDDDASALNHRPPPDPPGHDKNHHSGSNGQRRVVTISLASLSHDELRELRQTLTAELEQVRAVLRRLEALELQFSAPSTAAPATGCAMPQLSDKKDAAPLPSKPAPTKSHVAPHRRQLSIFAPDGISVAMEKEKRTPKANQYYNSDFVLGKEKFPPPDRHKKSKTSGGKKQEPAIHAAEKKFYGRAFQNCRALLSKLMSHNFGWVFNTPVDVKGLGLHDYFSIIKYPMDLGTVKSRLSKNGYKTPEEFAEDVRLTFSNAMTYNPNGQDVHYMAEQLSQIFEEHWPAIEAEHAHLVYQPPPKKCQPVNTRMFDSTMIHGAVDSKPKSASHAHARHIGRTLSLQKPKAKDLHKRDMTSEEKQKLRKNLESLPPEKTENIVQIIKKRHLSLSQHDEEIEVDIECVDVETLWELDRFVINYKKSLSKKKRRAELAMIARAQAENSTQGRLHEKIPDNVVTEVAKNSRTVADEKNVASSMPVGGEHNGDTASGSSSSSSSDSGSSSSDSDSESSSGYG